MLTVLTARECTVPCFSCALHWYQGLETKEVNRLSVVLGPVWGPGGNQTAKLGGIHLSSTAHLTKVPPSQKWQCILVRDELTQRMSQS
ncbi:hypothetical protein L198_02154 [Cryptococcus wingfieldii CBS 7118]|uniref:Uncharacterized protein n=1 Tax=Cryptococcus wingfieldii CBS 7118 TaxID=1295528 RepID=A0A1E3JR14_9TREE|nr:hypothetical protein L198_02154 [Cryptococcus wingfieldii CBS 7118]ODO03310.1 hypothetical protein L198_02154 [Cryptococcus wingfieldii CBS 7118]